MIKPGDTVRYLNSVGGGVVTRVDGKIAFVDDQGFETPFQIKELVVVVPAGHPRDAGSPDLMFDQKAFDAGKHQPDKEIAKETPLPEPAPLPPAEETEYGNKITLSLAFEPSDVKKLQDSTFNAVLVNDSNYTLQFMLAGRNPEGAEWTIIYQGDVGPNELIDLARFNHSSLGRIERIIFQAIAFKADRPFEVKNPISVMRKLDLTKFHKFHCFRSGRFFDTPVLEFPLIDADKFRRPQ